MLFPSDSAVEGEALRRLVREVKAEFLARPMYVDRPHELRQLNCVRVVAVETFERLAVHEQLAIVADLLGSNSDVRLLRSPREVFACSDSPAAYLSDLICEVVWQELMADPAVRVEDELREVLAAA